MMNYAKMLGVIFAALCLLVLSCRTADGSAAGAAPDEHYTEIARITDAVSDYGERAVFVTADIHDRAVKAGETAGNLEALLSDYFRTTQQLLYEYKRLQKYIDQEGYRTATFDEFYGTASSDSCSINPP